MDGLKRDWTTCSKFVNRSRRNNQHNWGDLYDHSIIFALTMKKVSCKQAPEILRKSVTNTIYGFANRLA